MKSPTERFSDRVANYIRYRPTYPEAVVETLISTCSLDEDSVIADVGSGTGIFTQHLLDENLRVFAVEPNLEMRQAAEELLSKNDRFSSINGTAEATTLPDCSVDLIVAAQAFHWFQRDKTEKEFTRILKPNGWLALVWNQRKMEIPFHQDYDEMFRAHAPEYDLVNQMCVSDEMISAMFNTANYQLVTFENHQVFDKEALLGRIRSCSYTPPVGTLNYTKLIAAAEHLFAKYENEGSVLFEYDTQLYIGNLN